MNSKERVLSAINGKSLDRVPCDYWATQEVTDGLKKHFGIEEDLDLWEKLRIDKIIHLTPTPLWVPLSRYYIGPPLPDNQDVWRVKFKPMAYADGRGVYQEIYYHPLAEVETIEEVETNYTFPQVDWFDFSHIKEECCKYPEYAIECGYASPFFIYNNIRGLEKSLMDLANNQEYAHYVIERICDFLYSFHQRLFEAGNGLIDIAEVTDDFGTQSGLMISIEMFDEFFKTHYQRLIRLAKDFGIKVFHHDDGAIRPLIPRLVKLGIEVLNPVQWRLPGMDPQELKKSFGETLCFHGGVDNQNTLPFGDPKDVEREIIHLLDTLASNGTGYILAPCHNIQPITPVSNIMTMYEVVHHYGVL